MTSYTNNKNLPVPDTGQQNWADEIQEAFNIIDESLNGVDSNIIDKDTGSFNATSISNQLSVDTGPIYIGENDNFVIDYKPNEDRSTFVDETTDTPSAFMRLRHGGSNPIEFYRPIHNANGEPFVPEPEVNNIAQSNAESVTSGNIAPSSVDAGALSVDGDAVQAAVDGHVSVIGNGIGVADAIDPSSTSTPVQDAVDLIQGSGGHVIIPPQGVTEDTQVIVGDDVSIVGFGPGYTNDPVSEIKFQDQNADCLRLSNGSGDFVEFNTIDGIHITGPSRTEATGRGIALPNGGNQIHIGHVDITHVGNEAFYTNGWNEIRINQMRCSKVEPQLSNTSQAYHFDGPGASASIGILSGYPYVQATDSDLTRFVNVDGGQVNIDYINVGGGAWQALSVTPNSNVHVAGINHEPDLLAELSEPKNANAAVYNYGGGVTNIERVQITGGVNSVDFNNVYIAGGATSSGWEFGPVRKAAPVNNEVNLQSDVDGYMPCIYHGTSDQVTNFSGTSPLTDHVVCLGDLTKFTG